MPAARRAEQEQEQKRAREKGKAAQFVLADFYADVDRVAVQDGRVVGHNAKFDARVGSFRLLLADLQVERSLLRLPPQLLGLLIQSC